MHKLVRASTSLIIGSALGLAAATAHASCGSATCFLVTGTQEGIATPGQWITDISYRFIPMDHPRNGTSRVSEALTPGVDFENGILVPDHHQEIRTNNEQVQADISYGLTPRLAMTLSLPLINNRRHEHFLMDTTPPTFAHEETSGLGDIRLTGKYALHTGLRRLVVAGFGIKFPTGEYKLRNSEGAINEPTTMPGTGSWDAIVSAYYTYQIDPHRLDTFLSGSYQITTENDLKYKMGDTLLLNGGVDRVYELEKTPLTASLQLNLRHAPRDKFIGQEVPSTGGTWIYLTPGVKLQASPNTALYTHVQLPVYQKVNETNIVPGYGFIVGVSHNFEP